MAGRPGGSNTTYALLSPDPETLPMGEGVPPSHRRLPGNQGARRPIHSSSLCSINGRTQLHSELEIRPRHYPLGVGSLKWAVSAQIDVSSKNSKIDPSFGPARGRDEATDPMPLEYKTLWSPHPTWFSLRPRHRGATGSPNGVMMPEGPNLASSSRVTHPARARPMAHREGGRT